ncbi:MAG: SDR family NAD(P)-dependent oxidoreductase [Chloroflexota bacterium]
MSAGQVIIVTGASSGIGAATAKLFAKESYRVALAARRLERLQVLEQEIRRAGGEALSVKTDVTRLEDIENLVEQTLSAWGQIDILFNNAGFGRLKWLEDLDPLQDIEAQVSVNLLGVMLSTRAVLPHMIERQRGHIINMVSVAGLVAMPTYSVYAATKFGVRGFTEALRREVRGSGVLVSGIYPAGVTTEFETHTGADRRTRITTPAWLLLSSDQVAEEVLRVVRKPRRRVVIPRLLGLGAWLLDIHFPSLSDWFTERFFTRPERE